MKGDLQLDSPFGEEESYILGRGALIFEENIDSETN